MGHPDEVDVIVCGGGPAGNFMLNVIVTQTLIVFISWQDVSSQVVWRMLIPVWKSCSLKVPNKFITYQVRLFISIQGGANNRDDPWVYRPGIYVKNMQRDGM